MLLNRTPRAFKCYNCALPQRLVTRWFLSEVLIRGILSAIISSSLGDAALAVSVPFQKARKLASKPSGKAAVDVHSSRSSDPHNYRENIIKGIKSTNRLVHKMLFWWIRGDFHLHL